MNNWNRNSVGGGGRSNHNLFKEIISRNNLFLAWKEFKKGKLNKLDVRNFYFNLENNIFNLHKDLKNEKYKVKPYIFFYIKDPKLRPIHKASVKDRVLFQAVYRVLYKIFDNNFIYDSYSCRLNKGTHRAVKRLEKFVLKISNKNKYQVYALKCDIRKFFKSIDHEILLKILKRKIKDRKTLTLIEKIIHSFETSNDKGLPLGNVTSQLFANIYLNELDQFINHNLKEKYYLRYSDDFIILSKNKYHLIKLIPLVKDFLHTKLQLSLHPQKIKICKLVQGFDFLGYVVLPHHMVLRTKTKRRMFKKILLMKKQLDRGIISKEFFNQSLQSYLGMLKYCEGYKLLKKINGLIG